MREFTYVVKDPIGIHARPAGLLTKEAKIFQSAITLTKGEDTVDCLKLMRLMSLGVKNGDTVVVRADGADEEAAIAAMEAFFKANL